MEKIVSPEGPQVSQGQSQEEQLEKQRERQEQANDFKNQVLNQILDQQARARLSTLSLAKPEKAEAVTGLLINMARMGRFGAGQKVNEAQLIDILEKVGSGGGNQTMTGGSGSKSVNFTRRALDDDDEDDYEKIMADL